jgi:hypothetical protein
MDLTELGWDSVNWVKKKHAFLVVTVKAGGLTLAVWSWLAVTVNFGGLTLAVCSWLAVNCEFWRIDTCSLFLVSG